MASFQLSFENSTGENKETAQSGLGSTVLLHNALWFIRVRWIVVLVFLGSAAVGSLLSVPLFTQGIRIPSVPLAILALILGLENSVLIFITKKMNQETPRQTVELNIWFQIVFDIVIISYLVHLVGSINTFIAFTYLFHITIACIFFPRQKSLGVTLLAIVCYTGIIVLEFFGIRGNQGIFLDRSDAYREFSFQVAVIAGSAAFVWLVIWYLVSTLSETVRERDREQQKVNTNYQRLIEEKDRQTLIVIHDLKAPLAGIEGNIQVLKQLHWQELPESLRGIVEKIQIRSLLLDARIKDMLILGKVRSGKTFDKIGVPVNIPELISSILEELNAKIQTRKISIKMDLPPLMLRLDKKNIKILFENLLSNAVFYSYEGGVVEIYTTAYADAIGIAIRDHGIGIREDALPKIFDDYFHTSEASQFNRMSSGIGLAIVREIALNLGLKIQVTSELNKGTTFEVLFVPSPVSENKLKEPIMINIKIIDDDPDLLENLSLLLKNKGYNITTWNNTRGALDELLQDIPQLLILDVMFPENPAGGFDLAREIRKTPSLVNLPIILLTAINQELPTDFSARDIDADWFPVNAFLEKPVSIDKLLTEIGRLVGPQQS